MTSSLGSTKSEVYFRHCKVGKRLKNTNAVTYPTSLPTTRQIKDCGVGFQTFGYSVQRLGNPYRLHERYLDST
ncbi:hypothetical protein [Phormidesmis sp. 146-12]